MRLPKFDLPCSTYFNDIEFALPARNNAPFSLRRRKMAKLTKTQAAAVGNDLQATMGYLYRLRQRLLQVGFLVDDKLYRLVDQAFGTMHSLSVELHYLSCGSVVGRTSENDPTAEN